MKAPIHQMYCTHCTFGSSALERREGEIAERVLGYSARASSMEREELRKAYRLVERYLYYSLPSDAPPEEKLRLDAALAPRRFVFLPSVGGLQVLGQLSYRQKDTSRTERVGSYFGHLLVGDRAAGAWSPVESLKLWGAPWVGEDSSKLPFDLKPLGRLENLLAGSRPAIDDAVLISFLTAAPGQPFDDPQGVISKRWSNVSRSERTGLLTELMRAYLELAIGRRENVLVVAEPSVAALLFYGVARLLPAGKFREEISFSTFEPDADRLATALAATTFHDPETADLKPEAYRRSGYVINTFRKKSSANPLHSKGIYARLMVEKLAAEGVTAVDALLAAFEAASPQRPDDLEILAEVHDLVPALLDPHRPVADARWRSSPLAEAFLSTLVARTLAAEPAGSPRLKALAGGPNAMLLLDLMSGADREEKSPMKALLRYLPAERFPDLLSSQRIPLGNKADVLAGFIHRTRHFPENCPQLWNGGGRVKPAKENGENGPRLLSEVLARLDLATLEQVQTQVSPAHSAAYLIGLVQAAKLDPAKQSLSVHVVTKMDDTQLARFLTGYGDEIRPYYPKNERRLAKRLARYLAELPSKPAQFAERLAMLQAWSGFFDESQNAKDRLGAWASLLRDITALKSYSPNGGRDSGDAPSWTQYEAIGKRIAGALQRAMPVEHYGGHDHANRKVMVLRDLGRTVVGRDDFLPDAVWAAIREVFHGGLWNLSAASQANMFAVTEDWKATAPAEREGRNWEEIKSSPMLPILGVLACVAVLAVVGVIAWINLPEDSGEPVVPTAEGVNDGLYRDLRHGEEPAMHRRHRLPEEPHDQAPVDPHSGPAYDPYAPSTSQPYFPPHQDDRR